jgi:hypothetical protein
MLSPKMVWFWLKEGLGHGIGRYFQGLALYAGVFAGDVQDAYVLAEENGLGGWTLEDPDGLFRSLPRGMELSAVVSVAGVDGGGVRLGVKYPSPHVPGIPGEFRCGYEVKVDAGRLGGDDEILERDAARTFLEMAGLSRRERVL